MHKTKNIIKIIAILIVGPSLAISRKLAGPSIEIDPQSISLKTKI